MAAAVLSEDSVCLSKILRSDSVGSSVIVIPYSIFPYLHFPVLAISAPPIKRQLIARGESLSRGRSYHTDYGDICIAGETL